MGRYRPPRPKGTALITAAGEARLRAELNHLWTEERPVVTQAVHDAAKNGDRSENGDYIYGKKRLREIDSRVRFLTKRLEVLKVVSEHPSNQDAVYFGARVHIEEESGEERLLRILGPDEFDTTQNEISIDAPLARALLGKSVGDVAVVERRVEFQSHHRGRPHRRVRDLVRLVIFWFCAECVQFPKWEIVDPSPKNAIVRQAVVLPRESLVPL